jgi:hypothetical protein
MMKCVRASIEMPADFIGKQAADGLPASISSDVQDARMPWRTWMSANRLHASGPLAARKWRPSFHLCAHALPPDQPEARRRLIGNQRRILRQQDE